MRIAQISIANFRGISEGKLTLPGHVVLIGDNNSGKSSIISLIPRFYDPVEGRVDGDFVCYFCAEQHPRFDCARSAARYDGPLRKAICSFKYNQALWLRKDLVQMVHACAENHYGSVEIDAVTYVPLFPARQRQ